jgi:hypothetical protein
VTDTRHRPLIQLPVFAAGGALVAGSGATGSAGAGGAGAGGGGGAGSVTTGVGGGGSIMGVGDGGLVGVTLVTAGAGGADGVMSRPDELSVVCFLQPLTINRASSGRRVMFFIGFVVLVLV